MQDVRFAQSGDVSVAYSVNGDGPIDIIYVQGAISHLEVWWDMPMFREWCERIGESSRFIRFDKRGMGMSDRVPGATTLETRMDDIRAVLDAVGSERAVLIGQSEGGPLSMLFAAAYPERTQALVLAGAEVRERRDEEWPWGEATEAEFEEYIAGLDERWGMPRSLEAFIPSVGDVPWVNDWFGRLQSNSCTPGAWKAFARMAHDIDVRHVVPHISVPTLVYHTVGDRVCSVENARFLARSIPGSKYVERPGADHFMWAEEADPFIAAMREFLTGEREAQPTVVDRVLATILFTDIVDSTARASELGDRRWRELLLEHHRVVRDAVERHHGQEVDMAGDGVLATFDGPARAIACARAIQAEVAPLGLEVRAGVHTGEIERLENGIAGIAVHTGARVAAAAGPGEVVVSAIVPQLTAGSGISYEDRGVRVLKGVPDEQRLYAVA